MKGKPYIGFPFLFSGEGPFGIETAGPGCLRRQAKPPGFMSPLPGVIHPDTRMGIEQAWRKRLAPILKPK